jgi:carbon-monoxide dehydrogenase small subunit
VLLDGRVAAACLVPAVAAQGHDIRTIEGLSAGQDKLAESLTRALSEVLVAGCGGCAPGIVVSAHALLRRNEDPSANAVREALSGHLCRCLSTGRVVEAVRAAAAAYRADASQHDTANEN